MWYRNDESYPDQFAVLVPIDPTELAMDVFADSVTGTKVVASSKVSTSAGGG